mmetsp:Transcript_33891/g.93717  ORF Transcript_33891/g.93717 Transcript_33891/m.93717 type:complete len:712 (-) Transcript_33891:87-2222(-)|eukprot:CAMPEP_0179088048 /NCGR_PEP_ID=MMETSP0796-20121207/40039_1 /TAXON_ID=73915 /ORGANISM="Pyrodinium bahamense, Strain pbaha01" /LENGTH=711 /DNA_ID=CAMNT_0020785567 /DNA_START=43 /DNA_END=2178 /DNA_ORIENTATION=-
MHGLRAKMGLMLIALCLSVTACSGGRLLSHHGKEPMGAISGRFEPLRIHAATHNAGNKKAYSGDEKRALLHGLADGHEGADLVLLGLQEFRDPGEEFGEFARGELWRESSAERTRAIAESYAAASNPPSEVSQAHQRLAEMYGAFHSDLLDRMANFEAKFTAPGAGSQGFVSAVASGSPLFAMAQEGGRLVAGALQDLKGLEEQVRRSSESQAAGARFDGLRAAAESLARAAGGFPSREELGVIDRELERLRSWRTAALQDFRGARAAFPNLLYGGPSNASWGAQLELMRHAEAAQGALGVRPTSAGEFGEEVQLVGAKLESGIQEEERKLLEKANLKWLAIKDNLTQLKETLSQLQDKKGFGNHVYIGPARELDRDKWTLSGIHQDWRSREKGLLRSLEAMTPLELSAGDVLVGSFAQRHAAKSHCIGRGDLFLHAFVSPWSAWRIDMVVDFAIPQEDGWECAKGVNVMVLRAARGQESLMICALNTHQSFKGTAENRMSNLKAAMERVGSLSCDAVVFFGDFNTRLHCTKAEAPSDLPLFAEGGKEGAFNATLAKVCEGTKGAESCTLVSPEARAFDEMEHLLNEPLLRCYQADKEAWALKETPNTLFNSGLFEAGAPNFAPTYKLRASGKAKAHAFHRCLPEDAGAYCLLNKEGKAQHNPAWTDRVLLKDSRRARVHAVEYARRTQGILDTTDHAIVLARLEVNPLAT